jgi:hypothetical protein
MLGGSNGGFGFSLAACLPMLGLPLAVTEVILPSRLPSQAARAGSNRAQ